MEHTSGPIKAITLLQPYAALVAIGAKTIETRSWYTPYRGPLAIHAGKGRDFLYLCQSEPFRAGRSLHGILNNLPCFSRF